jgi:hypothetical protein
MEEVCERENCSQAYKRVKSHKGSPGIDGMTVEELPERWKEHWPAIREQLLSGTYKPQPVRRVEIPKPDRGVSPRGIPTMKYAFPNAYFDSLGFAGCSMVSSPIGPNRRMRSACPGGMAGEERRHCPAMPIN